MPPTTVEGIEKYLASGMIKGIGPVLAGRIVNGRSGYVATCVDRTSRYLVARKLRTCSAKHLQLVLQDAMRRLPSAKRKTLTTDNGKEFACHKELTRLLGLAVYFAHPYSRKPTPK